MKNEPLSTTKYLYQQNFYLEGSRKIINIVIKLNYVLHEVLNVIWKIVSLSKGHLLFSLENFVSIDMYIEMEN